MYSTLKRAGDLFVAVLFLLVISIPLLVVILLLRFTAEGEVLYRQRRIGQFGRPFGILKFATMLKDSPNMGTGHITLRKDPRVTAVGHYLRITKLNELPQILNVLEGTMSWVGPRPLVEEALAAYSEAGRATVLAAKPGITGIGSVVFRDEEGIIDRVGGDPRQVYREVIAPYKEALELWYVEHQSLWTDFKLMLLTAVTVILPDFAKPEAWFSGLPPRPVGLQG